MLNETLCNTLSIYFWNELGAVLSPIGSLRNLYVPKHVLNAVYREDSGAIPI